MKLILTILLLIFITGVLSSCDISSSEELPTSDPNLVERIVAATLTAAAYSGISGPHPTQVIESTPTPTMHLPEPTSLISVTATTTPGPTGTPRSNMAIVSGSVCFREKRIPAMTIYFQETESNQITSLSIEAEQTEYNSELAPGNYIAYAWLTDFSLGGLYSQAVICGLGTECDDHTPVSFSIKTGEEVQNIDLCDWYAFAVPLPPNKTSDDVRGSITGSINYPGGAPPELHIVAFNQDSGYWYYVVSLPRAVIYEIRNLPPANYILVGYSEGGEVGGHSDNGHTLTPVIVTGGETTSGIDINDWNAPGGSYPVDPTEW
jgi:hypothetical protein